MKSREVLGIGVLTVFLVLDVCFGLVPLPAKRLSNAQVEVHDGSKVNDNHHGRAFLVGSHHDVFGIDKRDSYQAMRWGISKGPLKAHDEYEDGDEDKDKDFLYMKIARADARALEKREYDNYELGHLYDALQGWKEKKDEGFVHKTLTFIAEHISLPMELFGRKVISACGEFFRLLGTIFSQSKGIIFLLSVSYLFLILIYFTCYKCCFRSRRNPQMQPATVHRIVRIPKRSGLGFMSYPAIYGRATNCKLYPNMSPDSVPIVGKKVKADVGDNMV